MDCRRENTKTYISLILLAVMTYGCDAPEPKKPSLQSQGEPSTTGQSLGPTVGDYCELVGYESTQVLGHSIVWGLPGTGSGECPQSVREYLLLHLRKLKDKNYLPAEYADMSAEDIINSRTTAVVQVAGTVGAGLPKGSRFDVEVYIPWSTQTTSLQGGTLFLTELQMVVPGQTTSRAVAGRTTAVAAGPIFINPFPSSPDDSQKPTPIRGVVLGGGRSRYDRKIQLALLEPNSKVAQQLQQCINTRFQIVGGKKVAEATRNYLNITIPDNYRNQHEYFVKVLLGLYLQQSAAFQEMTLRQLNESAARKDADYEAIAMTWEVIGRYALKSLEQWYKDDPGKIGYYAARTALHMGDRKAIDTLIKIAQDDDHPCQKLAIQSLHLVADDIKAAASLGKLLDHKNTTVRLLAYEGLRLTRNQRIKTIALPGGFTLETVETSEQSLIYVRAAAEPRIVIFGKNLFCHQNIFFETSDKLISINSRPADELIAITRQLSDMGNFVSVKSSRLVEDIIKAMAKPVKSPDQTGGIGLTFSQIIGILYDLCREQVIPAQFKLIRNPQDLTEQTSPV